MTARVWHVVHSWVGLKLSLFMAFVLITGTLAVLAHEIDWLFTPAMRVSPAEAEPMASWGTFAKTFEDAYPDWTLTGLYAPLDPWFAVHGTAITPSGARRQVFFHPGTGVVQGDTGFIDVHRTLRYAHRHLFLPTKIGVPIVSALSILLAVSLVSGLVIYKKFWRGFFRCPRRRDTRTFLGDMHRLMGLWSLWFVLLMTVTGLFYLVESLGLRGDVPKPGSPSEQATAALPLDELVAAAQMAWPELQIQALWLPTRAGKALLVEGQDAAWLVRSRANRVAVDPSTGGVLSLHRGTDLSPWQRVSEMADPLHFGNFGGLAIKLIWFVAGVIMTALAVTGAWIYAKRAARSLRCETPSKLQSATVS